MNKGMAFHCHHDVLFEYVYDYDERLEYIRTQKPPEERELRERLFQMIPDDRVPPRLLKAAEAYMEAWKAYIRAAEDYDEAWKAYDEAREAYGKAKKAYDKAREACDKAWKDYDEAWKAYDEAREAYGKARKAYDEAREAYEKAREDSRLEMAALHAELCPNCPWDGQTILKGERDEHNRR